jgi:hypothetical protein
LQIHTPSLQHAAYSASADMPTCCSNQQCYAVYVLPHKQAACLQAVQGAGCV